MPELPEVEVVRRGLQRQVAGRSVLEVVVSHPRAARRHLAGPHDLVHRLTGRRLQHASRRGKHLWLVLGSAAGAAAAADADGDADSGEALLAHLGMSGQLLVRPAGHPEETHLRARLVLDDGRELRFVDQRTFGGLSLEPLVSDGASGRVPAGVGHIARDPLDPDFDESAFVRALRRRHTGVKRALLDQALVSGVGNIYADEALWLARLHYARPTETLTRAEAGRLLGGARDVMRRALAAGGTSFDALYVDIDGTPGWFERALEVYGRRNEPCSRCGTLIRRDPFMNRSSYTCPLCQRRPRRAHW